MFQNPFWIGIYERMDKERYEVCKIVFGEEPKDGQIYHFLQNNWRKLKFSVPIQQEKSEEKKINPKRMQRQIHRQMKNSGIGTKAQQALKLQTEQTKVIQKKKRKEQNEAEKEIQYRLHQEKKKQKHRGH